jgi:hypothetical protein
MKKYEHRFASDTICLKKNYEIIKEVMYGGNENEKECIDICRGKG